MKTILNRGIRVVDSWALGAVLLVMALVSCTPQPTPAVAEPLPAVTLEATSPARATPLPTPASPEDWLVFRDPEAECTFCYPADADMKAGKSSLGIYTVRLQFRMPDVTGYQGMVIHVVPITDSSIMDDMWVQLYESSPQALSLDEWLAQLEPTTVGGQTGFKTPCTEGSSDFSIVIPLEDKAYIATPAHDIVATCVDPQALELFYRVLETFIVNQESMD